MTPSLAAAYEPLLARASVPTLASTLTSIRSAVEERIGPFGPNDAWFEERSLAYWDRVLTAEVVLGALERETSSPGARADDAPSATAGLNLTDLLWRFRHAHRGLFSVTQPEGQVDLTCLLSGAAFRLSSLEETSLGVATAHGSAERWTGLLDATVVPTLEGIGLLPGHIVYEPSIAHAVLEVLPALPGPGEHATHGWHDVLDALLSLRQELITRSRVRPNQLFRAESLRAALRRVQNTPIGGP